PSCSSSSSSTMRMSWRSPNASSSIIAPFTVRNRERLAGARQQRLAGRQEAIRLLAECIVRNGKPLLPALIFTRILRHDIPLAASDESFVAFYRQLAPCHAWHCLPTTQPTIVRPTWFGLTLVQNKWLLLLT